MTEAQLKEFQRAAAVGRRQEQNPDARPEQPDPNARIEADINPEEDRELRRLEGAAEGGADISEAAYGNNVDSEDMADAGMRETQYAEVSRLDLLAFLLHHVDRKM